MRRFPPIGRWAGSVPANCVVGSAWERYGLYVAMMEDAKKAERKRFGPRGRQTGARRGGGGEGTDGKYETGSEHHYGGLCRQFALCGCI